LGQPKHRLYQKKQEGTKRKKKERKKENVI
jgi:hypothetical protein